MNNILNSAPSEVLPGTTILYPTETVYGLGCRFDDPDALDALYRMKGRASKIPVALIACSIAWVKEHFLLPSAAEALIQRYWPGPLAMLLEPKDTVLFRHVIHEGFVGIRVSGSSISRDLAKVCGGAVVSTSANLSGESTPLDWRECPAAVTDAVTLIVDGGTLAEAPPSTLIRFSGPGADIEVLRQGSVTVV